MGAQYKKLTATILFIFVSFSHVLANDATEITINQKAHALVAPDGCSYQWYAGDKLLVGETDQQLQITESGEYSVEVINESGKVHHPETVVAVTAMGAIIKIYTIGDSTVQDYAAGYYPRKGWGQVLPAFFNAANVQVVNKAVGGTSSKSFYNSFWPAVRDALVPGDFVFIQFGINDRATDEARKAPTGGVFEGYLTSFVNETKAKGAFPVLVSTVRRNSWNADGVTVYDSYHDHPVAVRTVAKNLGVPLIDLDAKLKVDMEAAGKTYCTRFWSNTYPAGEYPNYPNGVTDEVHFQEMGAIHNASLVVEGIKELSKDPNVSKLIPFLKPQYQMTVSVNPAGSDDATTITANYPQGLTITLKTLPKAGKTFQKWNNNATGAQLSTTTLTTVTSGTTATSFVALYTGAITTCTASSSASGTTTFCQGGSVSLTASAGASYSWKNGTTQVGTSASYNATTSGSYTVEVTNAAGCKATSTAIAVTVNPVTNWYADTDNDGKGDPNIKQTACAAPSGYVADNTDLCPTDGNKIAPGDCGCGKTEQSCMDCNNIPNGSAILDNCSRCVNGTTGKTTCNASAEVEQEACSYDGITETSNAGFKGAAYVNTTNEVGASITLAIASATAGNATLSFRYANGSANDRPATLSLNGVNLPTPLNFPKTGTFTDWKAIETTLSLKQGNNFLVLSGATAEGLANIDQIGYVSPSVSKGNCVITSLEEKEERGGIEIFPNPFSATLHFKAKGMYTFYNTSGQAVESGTCTGSCIAGESLPSGLYLLDIHENTRSFKTKVSKQ